MHSFNVYKATVSGCEHFEFARAIADDYQFTVGTQGQAWHFNFETGLQLPGHLALFDVPVGDATVQT